MADEVSKIYESVDELNRRIAKLEAITKLEQRVSKLEKYCSSVESTLKKIASAIALVTKQVGVLGSVFNKVFSE